jgi:hypothetical protein
MTTPNQLMTAAVAAFEQWRKTRQHPTQRTPQKLQQQAVALLEHFPAPQIVSKLNISGTNLKYWTAQVKNETPEFVALPHVDEPEPARLNVELTFNNGCQMRLQGDISPELLMALTQGVIAQPGQIS